jgi:hypothetical protein
LHSACLGASCSVAYTVTGMFTVGSDWANAGASFASAETLGLTQTGGVGQAISIGGTFEDAVSTPEASTSLLLSIGTLISLGYSWLRQRQG